ncbi:MAG: DNA alkylation repair protein [Silvanigrellaceae bacterium]|nr:DNA alkylation repair protein [Silvanigrellaceae bacterium]
MTHVNTKNSSLTSPEIFALAKEINIALSSKVTIETHQAKKFFKTQPGCYSENDEFLGVNVPNLRKLALVFAQAPLRVLQLILSSKFNEERLLALFILTDQYQKAEASGKEIIYQFYLQNLKHVNNWNLVDSSAHLIIGAHLKNNDRSLLEKLSSSQNLWERRISIVSTLYFIRNNDLNTTFHIATLLLNDTEDLIHKAVGWMLREAGKRNEPLLINFLLQHRIKMPKTMLRYAMERLPLEQRERIKNKNCY